MAELLTAFAPQRCLGSGLFEHGAVVTQEATTLFVDLAGFTTLTDRLGEVGSRGTEELSHLLRGFFGAVTDEVIGRGGDPVAFGGDALTVVFDGPRDITLGAATESATAIRRVVDRTAGTPTSAGAVTLQTRIGIARGSVTSAVAHSARRSIPVHLGAGLDLAVAAEEQATTGQVALSASVEHRAAAEIVIGSRPRPAPGSGVARTGTAAPGSGAARTGTAALARLVHPVVLSRLRHGRTLLESHRSISVAFVRFPAVSPVDLHAFLASVGRLLDLVDGLDGELVQVSGGDKGMVAMLVFGAPVAHGDDPLRAVQSMLELRRLARSAAVGIATGPVFAALVGSELRRFPAHSGRAVNLAARLMQTAAPGQVLVEASTWQLTHEHLRPAGRPVLTTVKGQEQPVEVRQVAGWRRGRRRAPAASDPPLAGRDTELDALERLLDQLTTGEARPLVLTGDAGIGKSRLAQEISRRATTRGMAVVAVDAEDHPHGRYTGLWRDIVGGLTGTPARAGGRRLLEALTTCLPDAAAHLPALGTLLGVRVPDHPTPSRLPPEVEAELVADVIARLTLAVSADRPLLLAVESAHHLGEGARDMLEGLGRALTGSSAGLLVTCRTAGTSTPSPVRGEQVRVGELTRAEVAVLADDLWRQLGGGSPPQWLSGAVFGRAGGNPLFVRTVTTKLFESWQPGQPPPSEDVAAGSLSRLLAERVDRLPVLAHQVLNVIAVVREPCTPETVATLLAERIDRQRVMRAVARLADEHLVETDHTSDGLRCRVLHDVLRQVVYQAMSHAERDRLHRRLTDHLIAAGADPVQVAEQITRLDDPPLARRWYPLAAAAARAGWDVPAAVRWWRRALPLLSGPARVEAQVELLENLLVAGRATEVLEAVDVVVGQEAPVDADGDVPQLLLARRMHSVAEAALVCGDLDRSESSALEAMRLTATADEPRHQRAAELVVLVRCTRGDFGGAVSLAREQLDRACDSGDLRASTTAQASLGAALLHAGMPDVAAVHYEQARAGAGALGDVVQEVHVLSDLAGCAFESGRRAECVELLALARQAADRIGYRRHLAFNLGNEAQLRAAAGDGHAAACAEAAARRSLELGDLTAAANALHTWVTSDPAAVTDPDRWRRLRDIDARLGRSSVAAADAADLAVAAARRGLTDAALDAAEEATAVARRTEQAPVVRRAALARLLAEARRAPASDRSARTRLLGGLQSLAEQGDLSEVERGELGLERWRATRAEADRATARVLLRSAFAVEPSAVVQRWLRQVGEVPPDPPEPLPPPVGIARTRTSRRQLDDAFDLVESALSGSGAPGAR